MRHLKDTAFVVKRINFADSDRFVTLFTKHNGKVDVLAKGVRKLTSRRASHIELLNLVQFQSVKTKKNFILTEIEVIDTFSTLRENYASIGMIFLICELIERLCPHGVKHEDIFMLIYDTLSKLTEEKLPSTLFDFQVNLLTYLGFWDAKRRFNTNYDVDRFIEQVMEKKIKTKTVFKL